MFVLLASLGLVAMVRESQSLRGLQAVMWNGSSVYETSPMASTRRKETVSRSDSETGRAAASDSSTKPYRIAWLLSYPNSGTSYTMTLVERASNLSTASNYGAEVTHPEGTSEPLPSYPLEGGPFWEGLEGAARLNRTVRGLPDPYQSFVLTKTHCGSRCIHCGPSDYFYPNASRFLQDCLRTSWLHKGHRVEGQMQASAVNKLVHLIRNPLHNIVARFHLDRRHIVKKNPALAKHYSNDAKGFQTWCRELDETYAAEEREFFAASDPKLLELYERIPCHAEFFKYTQWHNLVLRMLPLLNQPPILTLFYENYQYSFADSVTRIMDFVAQPYNASRLREFRSLPHYQEFYTPKQIEDIHELVQHVALPEVYTMLQPYFDGRMMGDAAGIPVDHRWR